MGACFQYQRGGYITLAYMANPIQTKIIALSIHPNQVSFPCRMAINREPPRTINIGTTLFQKLYVCPFIDGIGGIKNPIATANRKWSAKTPAICSVLCQ
jgi:hypothetical protein